MAPVDSTSLRQGPSSVGKGQIIATSHDLTPHGGLVRETPYFRETPPKVAFSLGSGNSPNNLREIQVGEILFHLARSN